MNKITAFIIAGSTAMAMSSVATAGSYNGYNNGYDNFLSTNSKIVNGTKASGVYGGVNFGWGQVREKSGVPFVKDDNDGFAFSADAGYKFNPFLAAEVGYNLMPNEHFSVRGVDIVKGKRNYSFYAAGKGILPVQNTNLDFFGKLGIAVVHHTLETTAISTPMGIIPSTSASATKAALYYGGGAEYHVTPHVDLVGQIYSTTKHSDVPAMYAVTGGVAYTF